jgi:hypothetical protein
MIRSYRAEMVKLTRRRVVLATALVVLVFAVGGAATVLATAEPAAQAASGRTPSIEALGEAGGGTEVFRVAAAFTGTFLFVVFVGAMAAEHARGTLRTSLLRQPRRLSLLAGRLAATLTFAAVTLAAAEALTWTAARLLAAGNGVDTSAWAGTDGIVAALGDLGAVVLWVTGYAVLGTALGLVVRSVPVALAVAIAWAGPIEHLLQDAWEPASRVFPGLLLEAFVAGGTPDVGAGQALATVALHTLAAAVVAATVFSRRDVTT